MLISARMGRLYRGGSVDLGPEARCYIICIRNEYGDHYSWIAFRQAELIRFSTLVYKKAHCHFNLLNKGIFHVKSA